MEIARNQKGPESSEQNNQAYSSGKGSNKRQTPLLQGITCEAWGLLMPQTKPLAAPSPGVALTGATTPHQCLGNPCRSRGRGDNLWL